MNERDRVITDTRKDVRVIRRDSIARKEGRVMNCWSCGDKATHENYDRAVCCTCWGDCDE